MKNIDVLREYRTKGVANHLINSGFKNEQICEACDMKGTDACAIVNDGACEDGIVGWLESESGL